MASHNTRLPFRAHEALSVFWLGVTAADLSRSANAQNEPSHIILDMHGKGEWSCKDNRATQLGSVSERDINFNLDGPACSFPVLNLIVSHGSYGDADSPRGIIQNNVSVHTLQSPPTKIGG